MHIGVNVSRSFLRYTYVLLRSIFENHRDFSVQVYVFSGNVEEADLADIKELASSFGGGDSSPESRRSARSENIPQSFSRSSRLHAYLLFHV